jgi:hypothetical protein
MFRGVLGALAPCAIAVAAVLLPRPVPRLTTSEPHEDGLTIVDYHSHTERSHDGRHGWTLERLGDWHAEQGFQAAYVTDHNTPFFGSNDDGPIPLLPGVEWSVYRQHVVALGTVTQIDLTPYSHDTPGMVGLFGALHAQGALAIASLPEYWMSHFDDLEQFVAGGVDGFEIVNCAPKALAPWCCPACHVVTLARRHDLLVTERATITVGQSDVSGTRRTRCALFEGKPRAGAADALMQGDLPPGRPPTRSCGSCFVGCRAERMSWLTWIALIWIYRGIPRRKGQSAGLGLGSLAPLGKVSTSPAPCSRPEVRARR